MSPGAAGKFIFNFLSFYVFILALLGGVLLAADCLSQERREGTLGFLFLTDLKGYDVVLGKFIAISLDAFYALLAVFPVLGLSLLAGGVTGPEFGRMSLALVNVLFFSVATTMWASSRSASAYRAMSIAVCMIVGLIAIGQVAAGVLELAPSRFDSALSYLSTVSPVEPVLLAGDAEYFHKARSFWLSAGISHFLGWIFLAAASWRLPRLVESEEGTSFWRLLSGELFAGKSQRRRALLEINPVAWLINDSQWFRWLAWALAIGGAVVTLAARQPLVIAILFPAQVVLRRPGLPVFQRGAPHRVVGIAIYHALEHGGHAARAMACAAADFPLARHRIVCRTIYCAHGDDCHAVPAFRLFVSVRPVCVGNSKTLWRFFCLGLVWNVAGAELEKARNGRGADDFVCLDFAHDRALCADGDH